jgi:hypothetical protein
MSGCSLAQRLTRNTQRLGPIPTPSCLGQEAHEDWNTRLNCELIPLAEPGCQRPCWWVRHYLSALSPISQGSERAICILIYNDYPA